MPNINELIKIDVTRQTTAIPQAGFGNILVLSFETPATGSDFLPSSTDFVNFKTYTRSDFADDFATTTDTYKILNSYFSQDLTPERAYVGYVLASPHADAGMPENALIRILNASQGGFYCVCPVGTTDDAAGVGHLTSVAEWVEANSRICFVQTANITRAGAANSTISDPLADDDDVGLVFKLGNYSRSAAFYTKTADDWITGAISGRCLPATPGRLVFAYKELNSVDTALLSSTQVTNLDTKNYNYFANFGGVPVTFNGQMSDGGFIDLIRDTDWLSSRIREAVAFVLVNVDKIPYTEDGANILVSTVRGVLEDAVTNTVIDIGYSVTRQSISSIPLNDRANRSFPEITVRGRFQGAVQSVAFNLILSV